MYLVIFTRSLACVSFAILSIAIVGCGTGAPELNSKNPMLYQIGAPIPKGGGRAVIGRPHFNYGRWYYPARDPSYDKIGVASWYGAKFHGRRTANGEVYDSTRLTTAHPTLPLPSFLEVTNLENGRKLILRANDRGPFIPGRLVDVSQRASELLGFRDHGLVKARVRYIGPAPLDGDDSYEERFAAQQQRRWVQRAQFSRLWARQN